MTQLQEDIIEIYNTLVEFSSTTITTNIPKPIKIWYEKDPRLLVFEQGGRSVRVSLPCYYSLNLVSLNDNPTYLLPEDYDQLMFTLQKLINSGKLLEPRTCISPRDFGFDVLGINFKEAWKGPEVLGEVRFISGTSRLFKYLVRKKYKL